VSFPASTASSSVTYFSVAVLSSAIARSVGMVNGRKTARPHSADDGPAETRGESGQIRGLIRGLIWTFITFYPTTVSLSRLPTSTIAAYKLKNTTVRQVNRTNNIVGIHLSVDSATNQCFGDKPDGYSLRPHDRRSHIRGLCKVTTGDRTTMYKRCSDPILLEGHG
jgi:hypothetical protein